MKKFLLLVLTTVLSVAIYAQISKTPNDPNYYERFPDKITGRVFLSQKYVHLHMPALNEGKDLEYETNAKLNLGVGVSLRNFSINVFYGLGALNKSDKPKGKTTGLDIQLHVYPRKWAIDLYAEFPKGLHLEPKGYASPLAGAYYYRPDIKLSLVGVSAYYVPNTTRFSYRAAILQTEWQTKSAGSVLYGGGIYSGKVQGDSALVPKVVQNGFPGAGLKSINFISFGPGVGYAYTLVVEKHLFLTGSAVANLNVNLTTEKGTTSNKKTSLNPATVFKAALGYNSSNWNVSVNWVGNGLWFKGASSNETYNWPSGTYRFVVAHRFRTSKK